MQGDSSYPCFDDFVDYGPISQAEKLGGLMQPHTANLKLAYLDFPPAISD